MNPLREQYERLSEEGKDEVFQHLRRILKQRNGGVFGMGCEDARRIAEIFLKELNVEIEVYT